VPKESGAGEKRVALVPDVLSKLTRAGFEVAIESGAGVNAGAGDKEFSNAGGKIVNSNEANNALASADVVLSVQPLSAAQFKSLKSGAITISFLSPTTASDNIEAAAACWSNCLFA